MKKKFKSLTLKSPHNLSTSAPDEEMFQKSTTCSLSLLKRKLEPRGEEAIYKLNFVLPQVV